MMQHTHGLGHILVLPTDTEVQEPISNWPFQTIIYSGKQPTYIAPTDDAVVRYASGQLDTPVVWC